jgi:excisionase family DNA binding protein
MGIESKQGAASGQLEIQFSFEPTVVPQGDGSYLVRAGKPIVGARVLTVAQAARRWAVTEQHVVNLIDGGDLAATNIGAGERKYWRIKIEDVEAFEAQRNSAK